MTQPPQGMPPGSGYPVPESSQPPSGAAYPPPPGQYPPPDAGYASETSYQPAPHPEYAVDPGLATTRPAGGGTDEPGQPRRSSPVLAPVLAFIALLLVGGGSVGLVGYLNSTIDSANTDEGTPGEVQVVAAADASAEPSELAAVVVPSDEPANGEEPSTTDEPDEVGTTPEEMLEPEPEGTAEPITVRPPSSERADVAGSILFTRLGGDIWAASGTTLRSLVDSNSTKADSSPTWSADGRHIYFIRSTKREVNDGRARLKGKYTLYPTDLMRMKADGSDKKVITRSLINDGRGLWFKHIVQPAISSAANNVAVVSDGNDGAANEVVMHVIKSSSGRMRKVNTPSEPHYSTSGFGHNDPDFSPDGKQIAFTYNDNTGTEGKPRIAVFTCQTKSNCSLGRTKYLKFGYANPSWSPKGNLLAVEKVSGDGRDIAIITAKGGHERVRLTNDGNSFAPEFSPNGDQIAYLKQDGIGIDVRVMTLAIDDKGKISLVDDRPVTSDGEVDGESGVSWYVPRSEQSRSVDLGEDEAEVAEEPAADDLEGAPPPPPGS